MGSFSGQSENLNVSSETALSGNSSHTSARPGAPEWGRGGASIVCQAAAGLSPLNWGQECCSCRLTPAPTRVGAKRGRKAAPGLRTQPVQGGPGRLQAEEPPAQGAWEDAPGLQSPGAQAAASPSGLSLSLS